MKHCRTVLTGLAVVAVITVLIVNAQEEGTPKMSNIDGPIAYDPLDGEATDLTDGKRHGDKVSDTRTCLACITAAR